MQLKCEKLGESEMIFLLSHFHYHFLLQEAAHYFCYRPYVSGRYAMRLRRFRGFDMNAFSSLLLRFLLRRSFLEMVGHQRLPGVLASSPDDSGRASFMNTIIRTCCI